MPQLDFFSISNQFFWGIIYFSFFYIIVEFYVVPTLFASIFAREYFKKGGSIDNSDAVYFSFTAFSIFVRILNDFSTVNSNVLLELENISSDTYFVFAEIVEFEINKFEFDKYLFEDIDTN